MSPFISFKVLWKGKLRHSAWGPFAEDAAEPQPCRDEHKLVWLVLDICAPGERGRGQALRLAGMSMFRSSYRLNVYIVCLLHPEAAALFAPSA